MKKKKPKCYQKCSTALPVMICGDCGKQYGIFSYEEVELLLNTASFFARKYPDRSGSIRTRKEIQKLAKKMWRIVREIKKED